MFALVSGTTTDTSPVFSCISLLRPPQALFFQFLVGVSLKSLNPEQGTFRASSVNFSHFPCFTSWVTSHVPLCVLNSPCCVKQQWTKKTKWLLSNFDKLTNIFENPYKQSDLKTASLWIKKNALLIQKQPRATNTLHRISSDCCYSQVYPNETPHTRYLVIYGIFLLFLSLLSGSSMNQCSDCSSVVINKHSLSAAIHMYSDSCFYSRKSAFF